MINSCVYVTYMTHYQIFSCRLYSYRKITLYHRLDVCLKVKRTNSAVLEQGPSTEIAPPKFLLFTQPGNSNNNSKVFRA